MQVSVETTQGLERRMTVALPSEDIDSAVLERLQSLSKTTRMNGFRPGKVPFKVVKKRYEPQVRGEVLGSMINRSYFDAVQQENLRPAGQPDIVPAPASEDDDDAGFRFVATFEVYPEFEPVFDDSITVTRPLVTIEESDVDEMLENLRKQRTEYVAVERESANDDQIVIDFVGRMDGEEFDGGKAEKAPLVLGSNAMIPGFESQLLGLKAGDEKTITVTFPEEYQAEHLAGKETEFDIKVHEVKESKLPEFDEEMIKSFGIEDGTLESLRADIRKNMERELKQRVESQVKTQVMDGLVKLNPIDVPGALVAEEIKRQREQLMQQMPADSDSSMLADELFSEQATRRVQLGLVVGEIIQQKEIKADAAAVRKQIEELASSYQDPQQVIDYYYGNQEMLKNIEGLVLEEAVTSAVLEAATVVDEPTTFKDIMNPSEPEAPADSENS
ncbi:trigger factor [Granulosicoccus sp. 3-233]|uniref:trigger factor n=1 Tax=Granulosicoccus sp. 3-233 TaxID=3417969 RepID=UPI003D344DF1